MVVVVSPQHRLANRSRMQPIELDGESLVAFTPELQIRTEVDRWLRQARVSVDIVHEFDNIENIKRAVEVGSGIAILPIPTVRRELEIGSLKALHLDGVHWVRPLGIVRRKHKELTTAAKRFLDLLHESPESFFYAGSAEAAAGPRKTSAPDAAPA